MAGVEILAPLRIETRFTAPDNAARRPNWTLRLRVFPDEFSMCRTPAEPTREELERLNEALAGPLRNPPVDAEAAFRTLAAAVGSARAVWLMRTIPRSIVDGVPQVDATTGRQHDPSKWPTAHVIDGLPPQLHVWLVPVNAPPQLVRTLTLKRADIASEMDLKKLADIPTLESDELPGVWWNSFARAEQVGLATTIDLGATAPDLEAIVVAGLGDGDAAKLVGAHAATGRLAVLAQATPTNTVEGETTTELGRDSLAWFPLVSADPAQQPAGDAIVRTLTGSGPATMPLYGGDIDPVHPQRELVAALWEVLWGRSIRDVLGAGITEGALAAWARDHLAPEGVHAAIRVGEQPYGIVPTSSLRRWIVQAGDPAGEREIRRWSIAWRDRAAKTADAAGNVVNATTERLVALLGETAPTRRWGARPVASLSVARTRRAMAGMPTIDTTEWDNATAAALAQQPRPAEPLAPIEALYPLPGEPLDRRERPDTLRELLTRSPGALLERWDEPLGLFGHLLREAVLLARARVGLAWDQQSRGQPVDPDAALPVFTQIPEFRNLIVLGTDAAVGSLAGSGDASAVAVADRFRFMRKAAAVAIDRWEEDPDRVFSALLALLDTASHRVDPWIMGLADRRLVELAAQRAPFRLGAYGWVDRPQPAALATGAPPPGPTPAGVLHAPSYVQALTAALLRDATIRHPTDDRWRLSIESAKVRAAQRLAERVRLGVHPYEALGLEVERLVGDWNAVRQLRKAFPLRFTHEGRRCCDGARVLNAVLHGVEPVPAGLPANIATTIEPLAHVLDTYGDLLVADGVHALVSGRGDLANAAMEAAAGLGAPPELRAIRTPRAATTIRVSAWALLKPGAAPANAAPAVRIDPAFAQLLDDELGTPASWKWIVNGPTGEVTVSLADRGVHGAALIDAGADEIERRLRGPMPASATIRSIGGAERLTAASALAELLGGGDDNPPVPDVLSGRDDAAAPSSPLRAAMIASLASRLQALVGSAQDAIAAIAATDRGDADAVALMLEELAPWRLEQTENLDAARDALNGRLAAASNVPREINALRRALRTLAGAPRVPVLPIVPRASGIPNLQMAAMSPDGRPDTDRRWLEIVAAVRPRLALLEARQLDAVRAPWPAAVYTKDASGDPWSKKEQVVVAYGSGVAASVSNVAIAALDAWVDSVPSAHHTTFASFGFNGPKSRAPQAILVAVPPDPSHRLTDRELVDVLLETRQLVRARAARPDGAGIARVATPTPLVSTASGVSFLEAWWPA